MRYLRRGRGVNLRNLRLEPLRRLLEELSQRVEFVLDMALGLLEVRP